MTDVSPETMARELLPCPFCGNEMTRVDWHTKLFVGHASNCFLHGQPLFVDNLPAWNRRAGYTSALAAPLTEEMVERAAMKILERRGFAYVTTPEEGQDAYDITMEAREDARAALAGALRHA
jgi:hypothetical protein